MKNIMIEREILQHYFRKVYPSLLTFKFNERFYLIRSTEEKRERERFQNLSDLKFIRFMTENENSDNSLMQQLN